MKLTRQRSSFYFFEQGYDHFFGLNKQGIIVKTEINHTGFLLPVFNLINHLYRIAPLKLIIQNMRGAVAAAIRAAS